MTTTTRRMSVAMVLALYTVALVYACSNEDKSTPDDPNGPFTSGGHGSPTPASTKSKSSAPVTAKVKLTPTNTASRARGTGSFVDKGGETTVSVSISSGGFAGDHGLSIYEYGSCDPTDAGPAMAAGNHWNPTDAGHGLPTYTSHHLGDLGNISIDTSGSGTFEFTSKDFGVAPRDGGHSVVGHALIFHDWLDDGISPPSGNEGTRTACGVIELVETSDKDK